MSQSGYNIRYLVKEAHIRWLKPAEVFFILQNHEDTMISDKPFQKPPNGALFLFNKRVLRFFRKDGHSWRKKRDGRAVGEAHERLKVGNAEALNCYYAHGEQNPHFQRRSYWMLDPAYEHIVLVHYRDVNEVPGRNNAGYANQQAGSSAAFAESFENVVASGNLRHPPGPEMGLAFQRLEKLLSSNDSLSEIDPLYAANTDGDDLQIIMSNQSVFAPIIGCSGEHHVSGYEVNSWNEMPDDFNSLSGLPQVRHVEKINENGFLLTSLPQDPNAEQDNYTGWLNFGGIENQESSVQATQEAENFKHQPFNPTLSMYDNSENFTPLFDQREVGIFLEDNFSLTISHKQKFTIREISPDWSFALDATKVLIAGSFFCDPESEWACMFGDVEVPAQVIQEGVICYHAPPHLPGKVTICITSDNRESCSEIREFEYLDKQSGCHNFCHPESETRTTSEEMLLLVRFVQLLLSDSMKKREGFDSDNDLLGKIESRRLVGSSDRDSFGWQFNLIYHNGLAASRASERQVT